MTKESRLSRKPASCMRLLLCLMFAISSFAIKSQTVTGTISNKEGDKLFGVTVNIKGTNTGTTTDAEGKFSINASSKSVLVFSSVGYTTQEIAVSGRSSIAVSMVRDLRSLDEVVVTALGIKKQARSLGYSTTNVKHNCDGIAAEARRGRRIVIPWAPESLWVSRVLFPYKLLLRVLYRCSKTV